MTDRKLITIGDYIRYIRENLYMHLDNMSIEVFNKFNRNVKSNFYKQHREEFKSVFFEILNEFEKYLKEENISLQLRWFEQPCSTRYRITSDISFLWRYSENLLRNKYLCNRKLDYDNFRWQYELKLYLDKKFDMGINKERIKMEQIKLQIELNDEINNSKGQKYEDNINELLSGIDDFEV